LIQGQDVQCDESELTGEPDYKIKKQLTEENSILGDSCYMFGKSLVVEGSGTAVIIAVGDYSVSGIIESKSQT
jgi:magnesium-transporting ATPase (P-type)|tara:strand:+ start:867 stop:1085 length:219 start_codon:yes stop_codon:yes gene_type:complete